MTWELAAGADPNASVHRVTPDGEAFQFIPLCQAAGRGHLEAARLLLDAGADPSRADGAGTTPLMMAAITNVAAVDGQLELLRLLLGRGAAIDAVRDGHTAFHLACMNGQPECAEALARAGCDVRLKTKGGRTGREVAEAKGHTAVMERLRALVADQLRAPR